MYSKDKELRFAFEDKSSPHHLIMPFIGENSKVLDVGCNVGYVGEYLKKQKGCVCDGIDINASFLERAKKAGYRNTYNIDLYYDNFRIEEKYDRILFVDILEHLPNPQKILQKIVRDNLRDCGKVIVCLPNIGRFEYRLSHLCGSFNYENSRVLHQDHLRFYTRDSGMELIRSSGLRIKNILTTGFNVKFKLLSTLTAFQFIYVCEKIVTGNVEVNSSNYYNSESLIARNVAGYSKEQLNFVLDILKKLRGSSTKKPKILDVGCNDGVLTKCYMEYGNVLGIDINQHAIDRCKEIGVNALRSTMEELLRTYEGKFDVVIATNIIEHIFDTDSFLKTTYALLKPGGYLIISTPNLASLGRRWRLMIGLNPFVEYSIKLPSEDFNVGHIRYYTYGDLIAQLKDTGFTNVSISGDAINLRGGFYIPYKIARRFPNFSAHLLGYAKKS